jgi:SAM-dependent methyltransferase
MARRERRALELAERRKEKKTHQEARATTALQFLDEKRQEYAKAWRETAVGLARDGHYAWMAALLGDRCAAPTRKVLEMGVGTGESTGVLLQAGWRVVGIDENVACLQAAHRALSGNLVLRGHPNEPSPGVYSVSYDDRARPAFDLVGAQLRESHLIQASLVLMEGDIAADSGLTQAVVDAGPFDAVACWLLDTHDARSRDARIRTIGIRGAEEYRLGMQRLVYLLSDTVLRPGGVLQIVDDVPGGHGGGGLSVAAAEGLVRLQRGMARGTALQLLSIDTRGSLVSTRSVRSGHDAPIVSDARRSHPD